MSKKYTRIKYCNVSWAAIKGRAHTANNWFVITKKVRRSSNKRQSKVTWSLADWHNCSIAIWTTENSEPNVDASTVFNFFENQRGRNLIQQRHDSSNRNRKFIWRFVTTQKVVKALYPLGSGTSDGTSSRHE
jgi:hypothetical protein